MGEPETPASHPREREGGGGESEVKGWGQKRV